MSTLLQGFSERGMVGHMDFQATALAHLEDGFRDRALPSWARLPGRARACPLLGV